MYNTTSSHDMLLLFSRIFPSLTKIIYLDIDTIVIHDIWELWKDVLSTDKLLVVAQR